MHSSSAFAPLLFPKSNNPDGLPPRPGTGSAQNRGAGFPRRPFSGNLSNRPHSLPSLADDDPNEGDNFNHYQSSFGHGSRPPSGARRQAVRQQAKAVAEKIATKGEATPLEDSQLRRSKSIVQSMGEIEKLGVGEEGSDEMTDLGKIIGFMKQHDPRAKDAPEENEEDDNNEENEEEQEQGGDEKKNKEKDSLTALRKKRATIDARVYARAQEMIESGEITDEWIEAAFRHINRASGKAEDTRRSNAVFALNEEELPSMKFPLEDPEGTIRRPQGRPGWSYVLRTHGDLPPKTPRQLRAEKKHQKIAQQNLESVTVDEDYIARFFSPPDRRANDVKKELAKIEKERKATMLSKDEEGNPLVWTDEIQSRLAEHQVEVQKKNREKYERQLDKEAKDLQKQKTLDREHYDSMVHRVSEEYVERKKHHHAKARREVEKELKQLFVPAIHHPARDGSRRKEIYPQSPGSLSPDRTKEMANRLSTDYIHKKEEHKKQLMDKLEEERFRFVDERTKEMYLAQKNHPLSPEEVRELGDRLALPVARHAAEHHEEL